MGGLPPFQLHQELHSKGATEVGWGNSTSPSPLGRPAGVSHSGHPHSRSGKTLQITVILSGRGEQNMARQRLQKMREGNRAGFLAPGLTR